MKLHAYVLAADPTWLCTSVSAYYPHIDRLVVSYDRDGLGWTGAPVDVATCLSRLEQLDTDGKIELLPGTHRNRPGETTAADTRQRQRALDAASDGADWVLQIDTDEVLPSPSALARVLVAADDRDVPAVEWPMRVLYRHVWGSRYLAVTGPGGEPHHDYPGPIAVRPGARLVDCRRSGGAFLRPLVDGDTTSLQVARPPTDGEHRLACLSQDEAIWHNSWARSPAVVRAKVASWGHHQGVRSWRYYTATWLTSPVMWRWRRDLHPFSHGLWPRLAVAPELPFALHPGDRTP